MHCSCCVLENGRRGLKYRKYSTRKYVKATSMPKQVRGEIAMDPKRNFGVQLPGTLCASFSLLSTYGAKSNQVFQGAEEQVLKNNQSYQVS
jgi:hypothetical protein